MGEPAAAATLSARNWLWADAAGGANRPYVIRSSDCSVHSRTKLRCATCQLVALAAKRHDQGAGKAGSREPPSFCDQVSPSNSKPIT